MIPAAKMLRSSLPALRCIRSGRPDRRPTRGENRGDRPRVVVKGSQWVIGRPSGGRPPVGRRMRHITLIPHRGGRLTVERKFERLRMEQTGCGPLLNFVSSPDEERLVSCLLVADAFDDPVRPKPPPPRPPGHRPPRSLLAPESVISASSVSIRALSVGTAKNDGSSRYVSSIRAHSTWFIE